MPITSPAVLTRGPPELPGEMEASVWSQARVFAGAGEVAFGAGDDAEGDGAGESPGGAHGHDEVALGEFGGVAERGEGKRGGVGGAFELDEGEVRVLVGAEDGGLEGLSIVEEAADFDGLIDDVPVGEDLALGGDEDAGAGEFVGDFLPPS